jgi:hypothetical protein
LTFREKGRRGRWTLPIAYAFGTAVRLQVNADKAAKKGGRK